jgi:antitoxin (DNA-binding transcriptional repressor) of toxin-antitoxin stability system
VPRIDDGDSGASLDYISLNMVIYIVMLVINIVEAKAKLSEYLELAAGGERVVICKRNRPVAELRAVAAPRTEPRPVGGGKGTLTVPGAFFEPLPDDLLDAFTGGPVPGHARVAETSPEYGGSKRPARRRTR